eukprot:6087468-Ditylum_brightwellii.AAC.2
MLEDSMQGKSGAWVSLFKNVELEALKENVQIQVIGLGWEDFSTPWSKNGKAFFPDELVTYLKMMIPNMQSQLIPAKPPVNFQHSRHCHF